MSLSPLERKVALMRKGVFMSEIGRSLGITGAQVSYVVAGKRRSPRVEAAVAEVLGRPVAEVFPESAVHQEEIARAS